MDKKYLFITPWCPYPPYKNGGVHTIYNILLNKSPGVNIDVLYYLEQDSIAESEILKYVEKIYYQKLFKEPSKISRFRNLIVGMPDQLTNITIQQFNLKISYDLYDVIILDQVYSLEFLKIIPKVKPIIAMMHDNHILMYSRKYQHDKWVVKKIYDKLQCSYFKKYESKSYGLVDKVLYVSHLDAEYSKVLHPYFKDKFDSLTLGVEIPKENQISIPEHDYSLVFSGVMDYGPNEDAAIYFTRDIFPKLRKIIPSCTITLAGKNPSKDLLELQSENVIVTGFVDDMIQTITKSSIYISPLRYGSGTKNKILEAMAAGMPVMLSSVSREGINGLIDQENCIFVEDNEWIEKIVTLFSNAELRRNIAKNGKEYVKKQHSWKTVFDKFLIS